MKLKLEFETDPDSDNGVCDQEELTKVLNYSKYISVLWDLDQWLRQNTKYAPDDSPDGAVDAYQKTRDQLWELLREEGVGIE